VQTFRVLSLDGGGIKGLFPASFLATIEKTSGKRIRDYFDLIVGTSTGGILALGLGLGLPASAIVEFYMKKGPRIFPTLSLGSRIRKRIKRMFVPAYSGGALATALVEVFGDRRLGESTCRLVILSLNASTGELHLFKTAHRENLRTDFKTKAVDIALATSAAPTYFPAHTIDGTRFLDGGIWANNPSMAALVEAHTILEQPLEKITILSLGCTESPKYLSKIFGRVGGAIAWAPVMSEWFMHGQAQSAEKQAHLLLGKDRYLRISPIVREGLYHLDGVGAAEELLGLGKTEARKALQEIEIRFLMTPADPFIPCYNHADEASRDFPKLRPAPSVVED